jgi:hypothetical protein
MAQKLNIFDAGLGLANAAVRVRALETMGGFPRVMRRGCAAPKSNALTLFWVFKNLA